VGTWTATWNWPLNHSLSLSLSDWGYAFKMSKKTETLMHINPNPKTHTPDLRSCF
jgi:hypothetical protein